MHFGERKKGTTGTVIISENIIAAVEIIISFVLIILVINLVFTQQASHTYQSSFETIARDIATSIDRAAASAGSMVMNVEIPAGTKFNLLVEYKSVMVSYGKNTTVRKFFSGLTHSGSQFFENPQNICIIKTKNDGRVVLVDKPNCGKCNTNDAVCDPECSVLGICDPACISDKPDNVCNPLCAQKSGICDPDCYSNQTDEVYISACAIQNAQQKNPAVICDPDSNNIKKGFCDINCLNIYSNNKTGVCDPDCLTSEYIKTVKDGRCYTGCVNKTEDPKNKATGVSGGVCDEKDVSNFQCVGDTNIFSCGKYIGTGNRYCCQPSGCGPWGVVDGKHIHMTGARTRTWVNELNISTCCCFGGSCAFRQREACVKSGGFAYLENDARCAGQTIIATSQTTTQTAPAVKKPLLPKESGIIKLVTDGICDPDCGDANGICDPDCNGIVSAGNPLGIKDPDCANLCAAEGKSCKNLDCCGGLYCCPSTQTCSKNCCGNGACEGMDQWGGINKLQWETPYNCADCGSASRPACSSGGSFTSTPCFYDTDNTNCLDHNPYWTPNVIEICADEVQKYLDRRNWDIKQVEKTLLADVPEGWAFDVRRYSTIRNQQDKCMDVETVPGKCFVQPASKTILGNEAYDQSSRNCCSVRDGCCDLTKNPFVDATCAGVGFCGDHSTAMLSILRTLGVPARDVFAAFYRTGGTSHAFVVYYCDPSLPDRLKLSICDTNPNQWIDVDATQHSITPLESSGVCNSMCLWYNDMGPYPAIDPANGGGKINNTAGWAFPQTLKCQSDPCCNYPKLCSSLGVDCQSK
jgi:hypothetical protein